MNIITVVCGKSLNPQAAARAHRLLEQLLSEQTGGGSKPTAHLAAGGALVARRSHSLHSLQNQFAAAAQSSVNTCSSARRQQEPSAGTQSRSLNVTWRNRKPSLARRRPGVCVSKSLSLSLSLSLALALYFALLLSRLSRLLSLFAHSSSSLSPPSPLSPRRPTSSSFLFSFLLFFLRPPRLQLNDAPFVAAAA